MVDKTVVINKLFRGVKFSWVPLIRVVRHPSSLWFHHKPGFLYLCQINLLIGEKENVFVEICDSFIILDVIYQP